MQQRIYRGGGVSPEALADYLVQHFNPQTDLQAQKIGEGESWIVQIARGDLPERQRHAISIAIARPAGQEQAVAVTMGQQQWITPAMAGYTAMMALIAALVTPWVLFALLWPASQLVGSATMPGDIWSAVDTFMASRGAVVDHEHDLQHPHAAP
jgi:hypothetical protein